MSGCIGIAESGIVQEIPHSVKLLKKNNTEEPEILNSNNKKT